jgi:hypothetical protein
VDNKIPAGNQTPVTQPVAFHLTVWAIQFHLE